MNRHLLQSFMLHSAFTVPSKHMLSPLQTAPACCASADVATSFVASDVLFAPSAFSVSFSLSGLHGLHLILKQLKCHFGVSLAALTFDHFPVPIAGIVLPSECLLMPIAGIPLPAEYLPVPIAGTPLPL